MRLLKVIAEIRYRNAPNEFKLRENLIKKIAPTVSAPPINETIDYFIRNKRMRVIVENWRAGIDILLPENEGEALKTIVSLYRKINEAISINVIDRIGIRSFWCKNWDDSFESLVDLYKKSFYKNNSIIERTKDVAIVLKYPDKDKIINFNTGPVDKQQLSGLIGWNKEDYGNDSLNDIRESSLFYDIDFFQSEKFTISNSFFKSFLEEGLFKGKELVKEVNAILEI